MFDQIKSTSRTVKTAINLERGKLRALKVHKFLTRQLGKTPRQSIRMSDEYAREVLGWSGYAPWLYVYSTLSGSFKEGWIPSNYYAHVVNARLKGPHGKLSRYKSISTRLFDSAYFPDLAVLINKKVFCKDLRPTSQEALKDILFFDAEKVIFKPDEANKGLGIKVVMPDTLSDVLHAGNDGVFQRWIVPDARVMDFVPEAVPTLRVTTVIEPSGEVGLRASYFRIGRSKDRFLKASSLLRVPIDLETGEFVGSAYHPNWTKIEIHPDVGIPFKGRRVPEYKACVQACLELHARMPQIGCIGWDMTIDHKGRPVCMEWNGEVNDVKFTEALSGPSFIGLGWEDLWRNP